LLPINGQVVSKTAHLEKKIHCDKQRENLVILDLNEWEQTLLQLNRYHPPKIVGLGGFGLGLTPRVKKGVMTC